MLSLQVWDDVFTSEHIVSGASLCEKYGKSKEVQNKWWLGMLWLTVTGFLLFVFCHKMFCKLLSILYFFLCGTVFREVSKEKCRPTFRAFDKLLMCDMTLSWWVHGYRNIPKTLTSLMAVFLPMLKAFLLQRHRITGKLNRPETTNQKAFFL